MIKKKNSRCWNDNRGNSLVWSTAEPDTIRRHKPVYDSQTRISKNRRSNISIKPNITHIEASNIESLNSLWKMNVFWRLEERDNMFYGILEDKKIAMAKKNKNQGKVSLLAIPLGLTGMHLQMARWPDGQRQLSLFTPLLGSKGITLKVTGQCMFLTGTPPSPVFVNQGMDNSGQRC